MKRIVLIGIVLTIAFLSMRQSKKKTIGLLVPIEHRAMEEMVRGFKEGACGIEVDVQNGQGDLTIQRAIIESLSRHEVIAAMGTDASLLSLKRVGRVVAIDVTDQVKHTENSTGVRESSIEPSYRFIRELLPDFKKVAMVYSCSDKNYQMVERFSSFAKDDGIVVQPIMVQSLADLYLLAGSIEEDVDAIFIAKDHLVASGAPILAKVAENLRIPLISSDEGTVHAGSSVAVGNREFDIGKRGGEIAAKILQGVSAKEIPMEPISKITLFFNEEACHKQGLTLEDVQRVAKNLKVEKRDVFACC